MVTLTSAMVCLLTAGSNPVERTVRERVDLIEVNHLYNDRGGLIFDQILFYEWSARERRYQVRDWKKVTDPSQIPRRDWRRGTYVVMWSDHRMVRQVEAKLFRETWTRHDPEMRERRFRPLEQRHELIKRVPPR